MNEENKPKRGFFSRLFKKAEPAVSTETAATGGIAGVSADGQTTITPEGTLDNAGSQTTSEIPVNDQNLSTDSAIDAPKMDEPISSEPISTNQPEVVEPKPPVITPNENSTTPGIVNDADVNAKQSEIIDNQGIIGDSGLNNTVSTPNNNPIPGVTNDPAPAPVPESGIIDGEQTKTL